MIIFPQINGIRIVILWRWPVSWRGHVTKVASLMEGEWSYYRGGQINRGRLIMLIWSV